MVQFRASVGRLRVSCFVFLSPQSTLSSRRFCEPPRTPGSCPRASDPKFKEYRSVYRFTSLCKGPAPSFSHANRLRELSFASLLRLRPTLRLKQDGSTSIKWASYPLINGVPRSGLPRGVWLPTMTDLPVSTDGEGNGICHTTYSCATASCAGYTLFWFLLSLSGLERISVLVAAHA